MIFEDDVSHYAALEIPSDASPQEIKSAYLRAKHLYRKENQGLYGMYDQDAMKDILQKIEVAFSVLSDPETRKEYDSKLSTTQDRKVMPESSQKREADEENLDDLLINPPRTDFTPPSPIPLPKSTQQAAKTVDSFLSSEKTDASIDLSRPETLMSKVKSSAESGSDEYGRGMFIRKTRETRRISLDDLSSQTKISKNYLKSLEEEDYGKLPAPVFVRGFLVQISKILKLDSERLANIYLQKMLNKSS